MDWSAYIVPNIILIPLIILSLLRFENQRWIRSMGNGQFHGGAAVSAFALLTGTIGLILIVMTYGFILWFGGWRILLGTAALNAVVGILAEIPLTILFRGDSSIVWLLSTIAMWPVGIWLALQVYLSHIA